MSDVSYDQSQAQITVVNPNAFTYPNAGPDESVILSLTRYRHNSVAFIETATSHGLTTGQYVNLQGFGGSAYNLPYAQVTVTSATQFNYPCLGVNEGISGLATRARAANVSTIVSSLAHGLETGDVVNIVGMADATFNGSGIVVTVTNSTTFTYPNVGSNEGSASAGSAYAVHPTVDSGGKVATPVGDSGGVVVFGRINITDIGSGQLFLVISRAFTLGFTNAWFTEAAELVTGTKIKLDTEGVFPSTSPVISPVSDYYIRKTDGFTVEFYQSLAKANDATSKSTTLRQRASNIATITVGSNHGYTTGDYIRIVGMSGSTYNSSSAQITVTGLTTFTYTSLGPNEGSTADVSGSTFYAPVNVLNLGSQSTFIVLERSVTTSFLSNDLFIEYSTYLADDTVVQFSTTGTLPAPLTLATDYKIKVVDGLIQVFTTSGTLITLSAIGSGAHTMQHAYNFKVDPETGYSVPLNEYFNGAAVTFGTTGTAPSPLVAGTTYYVRRTDVDTIELYDTAANAINTASVTGRIFLLSLGSGVQSINSFIPEILVKRVERVLLSPSIRNGFIDLYAWDQGRDENLTILGHYNPIESEPKYRRIKIMDACQWVRMRYRRKSFRILTDEDYIPLGSSSAIIMMLRALELYKTNFYDEGQKYEALAVKFLMEDHMAVSGPESISVQFNSDIYQQGDAAWMQ
jgi:hypothetical protein